jgi:hypothetical protein
MTFQDLLDQYSIPYETEGRYARAGWVQFQCPFCTGGSDPNRPYCGYNTIGNYVNCWRCGSHPLGKTVQHLTGLGWKSIKELLGDLDVDPSIEIQLPKRGKLQIPKGVGPLLKCHRQYIRQRGFDVEEIVRLWEVQGIGLAARLSHRLFLPLKFRGHVVSWTTRKLGDSGSRYVSARPDEEALNHKHLLYGEDYVRHGIIVHEGPTDVWRTGPGAAALLGTMFSRPQISKIRKYPVRVICFDSERAAQDRASALADLLYAFPGKTYVVELDAPDPDSASPKETKRLRRMIE